MTHALSIHFENQKELIINHLNKSRSHIFVAVGWFTNHEIFNTLCKKVKEGIQVKLLIINDEINNRIGGLPWQHFIDIGGTLYFGKDENPMHHKFCIIDDRVVINGSFNWTYLASTINHENIMIFEEYPFVVKKFKEEFQKIISGLEAENNVIPFAEVPKDFSSVFNLKFILSKDIQQRAQQEGQLGNRQNAINLMALASNIDPENIEIREKRLEIRNVIYRLWKDDYIIEKIDILSNRTIIHFRTILRGGAWINGPLARFAWFLRASNNRELIFRSLMVKNIRINSKLSIQELTGNSIIELLTPNTPKTSKDFDWMENRGYELKFDGKVFRMFDHNQKPVKIHHIHNVKEGDVIQCEIEFPKLPENVDTFDLIEGEGRDDWENHWNCFEVNLKKNLVIN